MPNLKHLRLRRRNSLKSDLRHVWLTYIVPILLEPQDVWMNRIMPFFEPQRPRKDNETMSAPILKYFDYDHLPASLQAISKPFYDLAHKFDAQLQDGPEKSAGLRKLLEAKDCFVRAALPLLLFVLLLFSGPARAQTAKVIILTDSESAEAKAIDQAQKDLDARKEKLRAAINAKYLVIESPALSCTGTIIKDGKVSSACESWINGWEGGFVFSEDFRAIVPKSNVGTTGWTYTPGGDPSKQCFCSTNAAGCWIVTSAGWSWTPCIFTSDNTWPK